jgi:hypothetical protein
MASARVSPEGSTDDFDDHKYRMPGELIGSTSGGYIVPITASQISPEDDRYIRSRFVSLEWLARASEVSPHLLMNWQHEGLFPQPTYSTEDGKEWYSRAYVRLIRRAVARNTDLRSLFRNEYVRALDRLRQTDPIEYLEEVTPPPEAQAAKQDVIEMNWQGFLSGEFGVCLRVPWVPCMLRKGKLMRAIDRLMTAPQPESPMWRAALRYSVDSLDRLEMPFAEWDRIRFGKRVSRDTHIQSVRERFPQIFEMPIGRADPSPPSTEPRTMEELPC